MAILPKHFFYDPGVIFPASSAFTYSQADNPIVLCISVITFGLAALACTKPEKTQQLARKISEISPKYFGPIIGDSSRATLRITALGGMAASLTCLVFGAYLPGLTGLANNAGNLMASSEWGQKIQNNPQAFGAKKVFSSTGVYYGMGIAMNGLLAGGGLHLQFDNKAALISTLFGLCASALLSVALSRGRFPNPASPTMMIAVGTAINTISGILSLNGQSVVNGLLATWGTLRYSWMLYQEDMVNQSNPRATIQDSDATVDKLFKKASLLLLRPLERTHAHFQKRSALAPASSAP